MNPDADFATMKLDDATSTSEPIKVLICIPTHEMVPALFMYDLAAMYGEMIARLENVEVGIKMVQGTYVHSARMQLAMEACMEDADWILWMDTDHRFPKDAFFRLIEHEVPVVGINYSTRGIPARYVAIKQIGDDENIGCKVETTEESTGLEPVEAMGFGLLLMHTDVLYSLPSPKESPWFFFDWLPKRGQQIGEDVWFFRKVKEAGWKVFVDHDLSKECTHIGQWEYRLDHVNPQGDMEDERSDQLLDAENGDREHSESERSDEQYPRLHSEGGGETEAGQADQEDPE
jgi:hypothetical protein